jgi:DNA-binding winged helix-turn-helix (wHTH) protein/tetratricopeptide (TPR) repeat protein
MSLENSPGFLLNFSEREMNGEAKHFYQFKSFRLDVEERQLLNNNLPVSLTPKAFDVLAALVTRGGHLVEKDELLKSVWSDSFVEEANVARIVHTLRRILGDDGNGNKYIETVAKKGYRFVAEVEKIAENENQPLPTVNEKPVETDLQFSPLANDEVDVPLAKKPRRGLQIFIVAVGFLCLVTLISLLAFNRQSASTVNSNAAKSIAVLPVRPISTDNRDAIYELGIAESIILKLNATKGVTVRPLSAIRKYSDIEQDAMTAGKEQQVDYVLESNYQLVNGKILVTSQLFNVQTGEIEETLRSEKDSDDKFSMQDAIAADFGNVLLARFGKSVNNQTTKRYTNNEEAYRLYLQGMNLTDTRNAEDTHKAVELFEKAIKLDPNYALAYVGLAYAHRTISLYSNPHEEYQISKKLVERALQLDENLSEAFTILGEIQVTYEWNFPAAEKSFRRAIELNPNSSFAHRFYALHLSNLGEFDQAIQEAKTAIDLDPNSMWNQRILGMNLYFARRYDESIIQFKRSAEMDGGNSSFDWLSASFKQKGDDNQAFEWFLKFETKNGASAKDLDSWKNIYTQFGWQGIFRKQLKQLKKEEKDTSNIFFWNIIIRSAQIGEKEQAFIYLEKAYQKRELPMVWLLIEPNLDPLRSDPRLEDLIKRVGLK